MVCIKDENKCCVIWDVVIVDIVECGLVGILIVWIVMCVGVL